jgi:hypothetical protein
MWARIWEMISECSASNRPSSASRKARSHHGRDLGAITDCTAACHLRGSLTRVRQLLPGAFEPAAGTRRETGRSSS